eukprot:CAMPEP_0184660916 /NCGR_PEP_ID=MMETSP0308-20130426/35998_1 /TAXON_ID=38269 /ORGANISM="Gloeochaete witrockiana, Strain SAG 46.84" /LENGTH=90 /DNA_ID=CAMNT_0027101849 /DNA_START=154 /DNA_END=423 /DNA_ORIENTATION=+
MAEQKTPSLQQQNSLQPRVLTVQRVRSVFESHRVTLTIAGTLLSVAAAFAGYLAKSKHQEELEVRLEEISRKLEPHAKARDDWSGNFIKF